MQFLIKRHERSHKKKKAFALVEVILATILFSFVIIGTVKAFNGTVSAHNITSRQAFMRDKVQSQLALIKSERRIEEMEETTDPDEDGVYYVKKVESLEDFENQDNETIDGIYVIRIKAVWQSANEEYSAETYFYQQ
ncbi:MAG: hypothetical protein AAGA18_02395 [Verrucomicrobiota bacterium]